MLRFYGKELLTNRPTPKLQDHPLWDICDCLFNIFPATLHTTGGRLLHPQRQDAPCRCDRNPHLSWANGFNRRINQSHDLQRPATITYRLFQKHSNPMMHVQLCEASERAQQVSTSTSPSASPVLPLDTITTSL